MTKSEYMNILKERLSRFSQELQDEILEDYNRHFAEGEKQGKSEEEIIQELGNIEEMIRELMEMDADTGQDTDISQEAEDQPGSTDEEQSYSYDCGYRAVELDGNVADIVLEQSDDGRIYVDYKNNMSLKYRMLYSFYQREENGVFYAGVKVRETQKKINFLGRTVTVRGSIFSGKYNSILLSVKVPAGLPGLSFHTTSGDVQVNDIKVGSLRGKTKSGDIEIEAAESEKIDLSAHSGDLALNDAKARDVKMITTSGDVRISALRAEKLYAMTSSGDIEMEGDTEVKEGELITSSGDIDAEEGYVTDTLSCTTTSGDIEVKSGGRFLQCNSTSGDIEADFIGPIHKEAGTDGVKRILQCNTTSGDIEANTSGTAIQADLNTVSGSVQLDMDLARGMEANVNTMSGEIEITWQGNSQNVGKGRHCYGDNSNKVNVNTVSGDIEIDGRGPDVG
ncbi:MAG: DUF4097 family beta strand repeat protein [Acetatifactor sp.]|nr:DUF4097 family beta strand repeat protein [Acetatifactor sp.]